MKKKKLKSENFNKSHLKNFIFYTVGFLKKCVSKL